MVKFKMPAPSTVSRNFRWRDKENRSAKVQVMSSNFHGCQEKNPTLKIIDLTFRPNLHPALLSQTSPKEDKSHETLRSSWYKLRNFRLYLIRSKLKRWKIVICFQAYFAKVNKYLCESKRAIFVHSHHLELR